MRWEDYVKETLERVEEEWRITPIYKMIRRLLLKNVVREKRGKKNGKTDDGKGNCGQRNT